MPKAEGMAFNLQLRSKFYKTFLELVVWPYWPQSTMQDQKRLQGQLIAEQEALYGSKPSPSKLTSCKKVPQTSTGSATANRRLSLGGAIVQPTKLDFHSMKHAQGSATTAVSCPTRKGEHSLQNDSENHHHNKDGEFSPPLTGWSSNFLILTTSQLTFSINIKSSPWTGCKKLLGGAHQKGQRSAWLFWWIYLCR